MTRAAVDRNRLIKELSDQGKSRDYIACHVNVSPNVVSKILKRAREQSVVQFPSVEERAARTHLSAADQARLLHYASRTA